MELVQSRSIVVLDSSTSLPSVDSTGLDCDGVRQKGILIKTYRDRSHWLLLDIFLRILLLANEFVGR